MGLSRFQVFNATELADVEARLKECNFIDGKLSAKGRAKDVKRNEQIGHDEEGLSTLAHLESLILSSALVNVISFPKRIGGLMVNSYAQGQSYGWHVDSALMKDRDGPLRTDLSFTIALNDPTDYDGGYLEMWQEDELKQVKLNKGEMYLYPTGKLHRVSEVTRGRRLCCVGWIQSWIADPDLRDSMTRLRTLTIEIDKQNLLPEAMVHRHLEVYHSLLRSLAK